MYLFFHSANRFSNKPKITYPIIVMKNNCVCNVYKIITWIVQVIMDR